MYSLVVVRAWGVRFGLVIVRGKAIVSQRGV